MTTPSPPVLYEPSTERLQLRQWRAADREPFAAMSADAQVMRYFPAPLSRPQSDAMVAKCEALLAARGWGIWAVERKADQRFIGFVGLHVPQDPLPFMPCVEVAWRLARHAWHQGFATEAARAALQLGFEQLQLPEIVAFTTVSNQPSQAVMQRLGMARDLAGDFDHPALPGDHPLKAHVLYRISAATFATHAGKMATL
ncbi:GNAT family N-acetyltransferase [Comamonas sp. J-3]|uniref:GNAT family N-acetyltransferase n=1 Tax=Comamonas trifloxystrobinivorans TaxID=3350256 RepID=UPI0037267AE7